MCELYSLLCLAFMFRAKMHLCADSCVHACNWDIMNRAYDQKKSTYLLELFFLLLLSRCIRRGPQLGNEGGRKQASTRPPESMDIQCQDCGHCGTMRPTDDQPRCSKCDSEDVQAVLSDQPRQDPEAIRKGKRVREDNCTDREKGRVAFAKLVKHSTVKDIKRHLKGGETAKEDSVKFNERCREWLEQDDATSLSTIDNHGNTLLHVVPQGDQHKLRFLLSVRNCERERMLVPNIDAVNKMGESRAHLCESKEDVKMLEEVGCNLNLPDVRGRTPLQTVQMKLATAIKDYNAMEHCYPRYTTINGNLRKQANVFKERKDHEKKLKTLRDGVDRLIQTAKALSMVPGNASSCAFHSAAAGSTEPLPPDPPSLLSPNEIVLEREVYYHGTSLTVSQDAQSSAGQLKLRYRAATLEFHPSVDPSGTGQNVLHFPLSTTDPSRMTLCQGEEGDKVAILSLDYANDIFAFAAASPAAARVARDEFARLFETSTFVPDAAEERRLEICTSDRDARIQARIQSARASLSSQPTNVLPGSRSPDLVTAEKAAAPLHVACASIKVSGAMSIDQRVAVTSAARSHGHATVNAMLRKIDPQLGYDPQQHGQGIAPSLGWQAGGDILHQMQQMHQDREHFIHEQLHALDDSKLWKLHSSFSQDKGGVVNVFTTHIEWRSLNGGCKCPPVCIRIQDIDTQQKNAAGQNVVALKVALHPGAGPATSFVFTFLQPDAQPRGAEHLAEHLTSRIAARDLLMSTINKLRGDAVQGLPDGWHEAQHPISGEAYFYKSGGHSQWHRPQ